MFMIALLALFILAPFVFVAPRVTRASSDDGPPSSLARKPDAATTSGFPYKVPFEQGAADFLDGDKITILEVRGTAEHLQAGQSLHDQGHLHSGFTRPGQVGCLHHRDGRRGGRSVTHQFQRTVVNRGNGNFTLFLVMTGSGWPHVSFYPVEGG